MRFAVVLLVLLPCIALGSLRGFSNILRLHESGCNTPGGVCKKTGESLSHENLELVNWGVNQAASQENSLQGFKLEKVNSYSEQVVAGKNYEFDVVLANGVQKRHVVLRVFDQPWTNTRELTILKNFVLTPESDGCKLPGGVCKKTGQNLSKENLELVNWAISHSSATDNSLQGFKLKRVNSYSTQVVAGMKYEFDVTLHNVDGDKRNVVFTIFDQPWTKTRQLNIVKNVLTESCNIPGGVCKKTGENLSNGAQDILQWAIQRASTQENSLQGYKLEKVISHSEQVVAGKNYEFEVVLANGLQKRNVVLKVFDQSWTNTRELTILKNEAHRDGCNLPGGICSQSRDNLSESAQELLQWAITEAGTQENSLQGFKLEKINSQKTQVVAGVNYWFDVTLVNGAGERRNAEFKIFKDLKMVKHLTVLKNAAF